MSIIKNAGYIWFYYDYGNGLSNLTLDFNIGLTLIETDDQGVITNLEFDKSDVEEFRLQLNKLYKEALARQEARNIFRLSSLFNDDVDLDEFESVLSADYDRLKQYIMKYGVNRILGDSIILEKHRDYFSLDEEHFASSEFKEFRSRFKPLHFERKAGD